MMVSSCRIREARMEDRERVEVGEVEVGGTVGGVERACVRGDRWRPPARISRRTTRAWGSMGAAFLKQR